MAKKQIRRRPVLAEAGFERLDMSDAEDNQGILFDERMIGREEALSRFFTPAEGYERRKTTAEKLVRAGNTEYCFINPRSSFVAPQIRDAYDLNHITRTGRSIRDSSDGQLQNCGVAFIDPQNLDRYLADLNDYFMSDIKAEDVALHPKFGCYIITIFGHNRQLGIASANLESNNHPDIGLLMTAKVFRNPSFWRVIEAQAVENTGKAPEMWDRARSIVKYKQLRVRDGLPASQEEVAAKFNVDRDQIWRAERYDALPQAIKDLVMARQLPYSSSFEFDVLMVAYGEEYTVKLARNVAARQLSGPKIMAEIKKRIAALKLTPEAMALVDSGTLTLLQASVIAESAHVLDTDSINDILSWVMLNRPDIEEIRGRIKDIIKLKTSGALTFYEQDNPEMLEQLRAMARDLEDSIRLAGVQATVSEISKLLGGLNSAYNAGLIGTVADKATAIELSPPYLMQVLAKVEAGEPVDMEPTLAAFDDLKRQINGHNPDFLNIVDGVISVITHVSNETAQSQAERRAKIGQIAAVKTVTASTTPSMQLF